MPPVININRFYFEIKRRALNERQTHSQIRQYLVDEGITISERAVRHQLKEWGITRRNAARDVSALPISSSPLPTAAHHHQQQFTTTNSSSPPPPPPQQQPTPPNSTPPPPTAVHHHQQQFTTTNSSSPPPTAVHHHQQQ